MVARPWSAVRLADYPNIAGKGKRPQRWASWSRSQPGLEAVAGMEAFTVSRTPYQVWQYHAYLDEMPIYDGLSRTSTCGSIATSLYAFARFGHDETKAALHGLTGEDDHRSRERVLLGFAAVDVDWDGSFEAFAAANPGGHLFRIDDAGVSEFERTISMLESRGARVVLVFSPEWEGIRPFETNREDVMRKDAAIAAEHHTVFLDYGDSAISKDRSLFYNSQHMNRRGAALFSAVLANDLAGLTRPEPPAGRRP